MDTSTEQKSSDAHVKIEESGLFCPVKNCRNHFNNTKKLLKHFRRCHAKKWIITCSHCSSYVTRRIRHFHCHFEENHSGEIFRVVCICHSSHKLDEAMFKGCSFSVQYNCLLCSFNAEDVNIFNIHIESHLMNNSKSIDTSIVKSEIELSIVNGRRKSHKLPNSSETSNSSLDSNLNKMEANTDYGFGEPQCKMDTSSELESSFTHVEQSGLFCPVKNCRNHFKNAKKFLKHFKTCHATKWVLMCSHCSSYVTRKICHVDRHFRENHGKESFHLVSVCHSSHKLDEALFKDCSFSVRYSCLLCSFNTNDVKHFNNHSESHIVNDSKSVDTSIVTSDTDTSVVNGSKKNHKLPNSSEISHLSFDFISNKTSPSASTTAIYPCPTCGKCFTRERSIKYHMVVHTDERSFHCSLCAYKAKRKGDLLIHIDKTHQNQRPFSCHVCSKTFGFLTNLKRHLITHSDDKGFQCDKCGARFKFKCSVTKHQKKGCET